MTTNSAEMKMVSHVGRDLLQSASHFRTEAAVVWEYVVNSLQYVDDGVTPKVQVIVDQKKKQIRIIDNGKGMSAQDLRRFFTMHGENIDRQRGRPGRGKFGTGKSAAFGIASELTVETIRAKKRNIVTLDRERVMRSDGGSIDLNWQVKDEVVDSPNGTTVTISALALPSVKSAPIVEYIERHLQAFRARLPEVAVNDHVCSYREPPVAEVFEFRPTQDQQQTIGDVLLTIKVSSSPLPETEQGVSITAGVGNLVAIETGGIEKKEMGNYLFGEIDAPALDKPEVPIEAYDPSRSLKLNLNHPVSMALVQFLAPKLDEVRRIQVEKLREIRKTEDAKRLSKLAERIAAMLNADFTDLAFRLQAIRSAAGPLGARFGGTRGAGQEADGFVEGLEQPGNIETSQEPHEGSVPGPPKLNPKPTPDIPVAANSNQDGSTSVDKSGGSGRKRNPRGGFTVDYRNLGTEADRSKYDSVSLSILINLDHPVVSAALGASGIEDPTFRRLSFEIAFSEYAIAFGYEKAKVDPDMPPEDVLFEVRSTLNRVSAKAATLYAG
jgi:histidine kinase/DNA gyrase B/HSP90-like ATPase